MAHQSENEAIIEEVCLLAQAGAGDREAFRLLYERFSAPLFALALRLVGNLPDAEETLQDTFMKIWRNAASYDSRKSRPFTWAVTILRRTCFDCLRKRGRAPVTAPLSDETPAAPERSSGESGLDAAEASEDSKRLLEALAAIPQGQRRALELALFSDMTQSEIAQKLEQPVGTVKSWIRRGFLELRSTLSNSTQ